MLLMAIHVDHVNKHDDMLTIMIQPPTVRTHQSFQRHGQDTQHGKRSHGPNENKIKL